MDDEFKTLLEGDALLDLNIPLMFEDGDVQLFTSLPDSPIAHA
jgi:hypothetical protein